MSYPSAFKTPEGEAKFLAAYDAAMKLWPVPYEEIDALLLIGDNEVISDPARALERARQLIPDFEGELVPGCRHDMCSSRHHIVDARVLEFLKKTQTDDRAATGARTAA